MKKVNLNFVFRQMSRRKTALFFKTLKSMNLKPRNFDGGYSNSSKKKPVKDSWYWLEQLPKALQMEIVNEMKRQGRTFKGVALNQSSLRWALYTSFSFSISKKGSEYWLWQIEYYSQPHKNIC